MEEYDTLKKIKEELNKIDKEIKEYDNDTLKN